MLIKQHFRDVWTRRTKLIHQATIFLVILIVLLRLLASPVVISSRLFFLDKKDKFLDLPLAPEVNIVLKFFKMKTTNFEFSLYVNDDFFLLFSSDHLLRVHFMGFQTTLRSFGLINSNSTDYFWDGVFLDLFSSKLLKNFLKYQLQLVTNTFFSTCNYESTFHKKKKNKQINIYNKIFSFILLFLFWSQNIWSWKLLEL